LSAKGRWRIFEQQPVSFYLIGDSMSAQEAKIRHQREYQQHVEAVRKGEESGRIIEKRPDGVVPAKKGRSQTFF